MHDSTPLYFEACLLAQNILGDNASQHFTRLKELSRTNSLAELEAIILSWRPQATEQAPSCKHFAGGRDCEACGQKDALIELAAERIEEINKALTVGAAFRILDHLPRKSFVEDASQSGWVKLLETGTTDAKSANVAGQTAARDLVRTERQYIGISETRETDDGELETVAPWDTVNPSDEYRARSNLYEIIFGKIAAELRFKKQREILDAFAQESPADYKFLINYLTSRRGKNPHTRHQRNRAGSIMDKLRRRFKKVDRDREKPAEK